MISFLIPAYNEADSIQNTIEQLRSIMDTTDTAYEIIVIDDGSQDNTAELASRIGAEVVQHPTNKGYGRALKTGIHHANYEWCAIVDADGSYPLSSFPALIESIPRFDMVVGTRTGKTYWGSPGKRLGRLFLHEMVRFVTGTKVPDINSGMRIFRRNIALTHIKRISSGFSFTTTLTLAMLMEDHAIKYVPIEYYPRVGKSKVKIGKDTLRVMQILAQAIVFYNPLKLFLLLACLSAGVGLVFLLLDLVFELTLGIWFLAVSGLVAIVIGGLGFLAEAIRLHRITLDR